MIEYIGGWIEGATAASRFFARDSSGSSWFTPETIPAWAAFGAALLSAVATFQAVKISRQTIVNENKKETIRLLIEAGALYERVSDFLSIEKNVVVLKLDSLPPFLSEAKQSVLRTLTEHENGSTNTKANIYTMLDEAIKEKNQDIGLWQQKLSEAQKLFSDAGRAMPMVEGSIRSQMEMIERILEVYRNASART